MSIFDTVQVYKTPIGLILTLFGPQILRRVITYNNNRNRPSQSQTTSKTTEPVSGRLKAFLAVYTLYHLSHLLIPPFDLFSTPYLPVLAPNDILRSRLYPSASAPGSPQNPLIDLLLTRLQNLDSRILYLRYGHEALQGCLWCRTPLDYLIFSLPGILSRYLLATLVLICLGNETLAGPSADRRGKKWTSPGIWWLGIGCLGEIAVRYFWDLRISNGDPLHVRSFLPICSFSPPHGPYLSILSPLGWTDRV